MLVMSCMLYAVFIFIICMLLYFSLLYIKKLYFSSHCPVYIYNAVWCISYLCMLMVICCLILCFLSLFLCIFIVTMLYDVCCHYAVCLNVFFKPIFRLGWFFVYHSRLSHSCMLYAVCWFCILFGMLMFFTSVYLCVCMCVWCVLSTFYNTYAVCFMLRYHKSVYLRCISHEYVY